MQAPAAERAEEGEQLPKAPTGIDGFDEITGGGLPQGRVSLVCGSTGCGKTLFAMEFLVHGARQFGENGVFMAFEETEADLQANVASLGFGLGDLVEQGKVAVDHVRIEPSEIEDTGEYDLEGLFVRLDHAIRRVGAKRVVLDTVEALFGGLANHSILRAELRRLFQWLKDRGVTAVVTGERGEKSLTRQGLEEYVSDCVVFLDHRVQDQVSTRWLRVVKYRGSVHGTNEYPFLIDSTGIVVLPVTSLGLAHRVSEERVSTGIPGLDSMLGGEGFYRGSSVLISGSAGTGKTSFAGHMAAAACGRGERVLYVAFEESPDQIIRNLRSIGLDLAPCMESGLLRFHASRPTAAGLETHLTAIHKEVEQQNPGLVVVDPMSSFTKGGAQTAVSSMLLRLLDFLKSRGITAVFTSLTSDMDRPEHTQQGVSSLMDAWLLLRNLESAGERNRGLYVLKSRGMGHSNQIREFELTDQGIVLREPYVGPGGLFTGSARVAQELRDKAELEKAREDVERRQRELERKRRILEAQTEVLRAAFEGEEESMTGIIDVEVGRQRKAAEEREALEASRADEAGAAGRTALPEGEEPAGPGERGPAPFGGGPLERTPAAAKGRGRRGGS